MATKLQAKGTVSIWMDSSISALEQSGFHALQCDYGLGKIHAVGGKDALDITIQQKGNSVTIDLEGSDEVIESYKQAVTAIFKHQSVTLIYTPDGMKKAPLPETPPHQEAVQEPIAPRPPVDIAVAPSATVESLSSVESYFDGGLLQLIGWSILAVLVTFITLGICLPWGYCFFFRWEINHTVVNGRRLAFDGTGGQLFGNYIKWFLLTLITLGIYGLWIGIKLEQWKVKHTHFA